MACLKSLFFCAVLSYFLQCTAASLAKNPSAKGKFTKMYSFGDSLTDTGNNPSPGSPFGKTLGRYTGRWSDGKLVVDFMAEELGLPLLPPNNDANANFSHGINFAYAGARVIPFKFYEMNNFKNPYTPFEVKVSLETEFDSFNQFVDSHKCAGKTPDECKAVMESAFFWLGSIGANDYFSILESSINPSTIKKMAVPILIKVLEGLIAKGAKYIAVEGPIGALPDQTIIASHNELIKQKLEEVRRKNPGCVILFADYFRANAEIQMNMRKYGLTQGFSTPCCGPAPVCGLSGSIACADPSKYLVWDGIHPTEAANKAIFDLFLRQGYMNPPFASLFAK